MEMNLLAFKKIFLKNTKRFLKRDPTENYTMEIYYRKKFNNLQINYVINCVYLIIPYVYPAVCIVSVTPCTYYKHTCIWF